jgi:regulator of cell morphogenesis and NO signaling
MEQLATKTLAQIVNENHQAATVFEKYGLDFCCKGKRSLQTACEEKKLPLAEVATELATVINQKAKTLVAFEKFSLSALIHYIVTTHHAYVKQEMPQLFSYLHKIASKHGERHSELNKIFEAFASLKEELESHMHKEEFILFPRIIELENSIEEFGKNISINYIQGPVNVMEHEHDHAGNLLEEIKRYSDNYTPPADACTTYRLAFAALRSFESDLHQHIHLENNILFPKAIELFRTIKQATLN